MGRPESYEIKETPTETISMGFLQIQGFNCTEPRELIAKALEGIKRAYSVAELVNETGLPRMTVYRNLRLLCKKRLIHNSPSLDAYFACQKLFKARSKDPKTCHSYGICMKCKDVEEFLHEKDHHPRLKRIEKLKTDHEWLGLCSNCGRL